MALALLAALVLAAAQPPPPASDPVPSGSAAAAAAREEVEDSIPEGAPQDDYEFVAWCHGALAGQIELDPLVEKDMDAIEGKAKAAERRAGDEEISQQHKAYLKLYERALAAAEKASPTALHQKGVDAELTGYRIWGPTKNKPPIWRMVDWGNWEVPPRCEKAARRLYDRASVLGAVLKPEASEGAAPPAAAAPLAPAASPPSTLPAAGAPQR